MIQRVKLSLNINAYMNLHIMVLLMSVMNILSYISSFQIFMIQKLLQQKHHDSVYLSICFSCPFLSGVARDLGAQGDWFPLTTGYSEDASQSCLDYFVWLKNISPELHLWSGGHLQIASHLPTLSYTNLPLRDCSSRQLKQKSVILSIESVLI